MFRLPALLLTAVVVMGCAGHPGQRSVVVGAAVSLTESLEEAGREYQARNGTRVTFNFAASNFVATQVINGAPMDVFISADEAQMDRAAAAGAIDQDTRVPLLSNSLVIVMRSDRATPWNDASPLVGLAMKRVAVGDPAAVPAGVYAKQYLERHGLWSSLVGRVLPAVSVRAALAAVATGGADAGIVYATDVETQRGVSIVFRVPAGDAPHIVYPAALTRRARDAAAALGFLRFLESNDGRAIFIRHGFSPVNRNAHD